MTETIAARRTGFQSLRRGGLNWDAFPLRLFVKGNKKFWNPADIDFSQDAADWRTLTDEERRSATYLCAQFIAGEEAVTEDIQPFMKAMAAEGRLGDEMYLTQFCFEDSEQSKPGDVDGTRRRPVRATPEGEPSVRHLFSLH